MNISAYDTIIEDSRTTVETIYTSLVGSYTARTSSILSTVSSLLIILIITKSTAKLTIPYHRLMLGMSICDTFASISMALTTLPMPRNMIYTQFEGSHIGTFTSCAAQSFIQNVGTLGTINYNVALSIYFLHSIHKGSKFCRKWNILEIFLHFICIAIPIGLMTSVTTLETMNPTPYLPWCGSIVEYPYYCNFDDKIECLRGGIAEKRRKLTAPTFGIPILMVIILMILIVKSVYQDEKLMKMYADIYRFDANNTDQIDRSTKKYQMSKTAFVQATSYIIALLLSTCCIFLRSTATKVLRRSPGLQIFHLVTRPLQGFFNLIVFVGDKAHSYRNSHPEVGMLQACFDVVFKPQEEPFVFRNVSMVQVEHRNRRENTNDDESSEGLRGDANPSSIFPIRSLQDDVHTCHSTKSALKYDTSSSILCDRSHDPSFVISDRNVVDDEENERSNDRTNYYKKIRDQYYDEDLLQKS